MAKLSIFVESGHTTHELTEERITLGRAPDNMIQIDDPSVSGRHAQLSLIDDRYQLKDLGSTNGTTVNSEMVTDVFLRAGDRLRFGQVEARFESDATAAQALPDAGPIEARLAAVSEKPPDFANASPFPHRQKEKKDATATAVLAVAVVAIVAFLISLLGLFQMHGPR